MEIIPEKQITSDADNVSISGIHDAELIYSEKYWSK